MARSRKRTAVRPASRPRRPPSLLVLHLDADKLRSDGLHLGHQSDVAALFSAFAFGANVAVEDGTDLAGLLRALGGLVEAKRTFDVIVVIAHSNARGIKLAAGPDTFVDWDVFANYLKPLQPRRLLFVACQAGRWPAANQLFNKLPLLRRIYASPVNASKSFGHLMLWLVPHVVGVKAPKKNHVQLAQLAAVALTGRQLRMWMRSEKDNAEGLLLDIASLVLDRSAQQVPNLLRGLLR